MKKLVILRGNSGSGKTIVAKKLQEKFGPNTMRLSHDMIRMEVLHVWGDEGIAKSEPLMINLDVYKRQLIMETAVSASSESSFASVRWLVSRYNA